MRDELGMDHLVANALRGLVGKTNANPTRYADTVVQSMQRVVDKQGAEEVASAALALALALQCSVHELDRGRSKGLQDLRMD